MPETIQCPWCGLCGQVAAFRRLRRPPGREHQFAIMVRCPECLKWSAPHDPRQLAAP